MYLVVPRLSGEYVSIAAINAELSKNYVRVRIIPLDTVFTERTSPQKEQGRTCEATPKPVSMARPAPNSTALREISVPTRPDRMNSSPR